QVSRRGGSGVLRWAPWQRPITCYSLLTRSHLINGRGLGGCRFLAWVRRDEGEYPSRPIGTTEEQRHPSQKATPSAGQEHFAASGRVACSLSRTCGTGMRV